MGRCGFSTIAMCFVPEKCLGSIMAGVFIKLHTANNGTRWELGNMTK